MKSLLCLRGQPIVNWVAQRLSHSRLLDEVIFAIPDTPLDDALAEHLKDTGQICVRGPEEDVLARFALAARSSQAETIVRVCADNPLVWGEAIDRLVRFFEEKKPDYAYNHIPRGNLWPDGLGAEICSRGLLEEIAAQAAAKSQREHVFNYLWDNAADVDMATFDPAESWLRRPELTLDVDSPQDFARLALAPLSPQSGAREIVDAFVRQPAGA